MKKRMKFFVIMTIFSHFLWGCSEQEANSNESDVTDKEYVKALELVKNFESEWNFTRSGSDAIEVKNSVCETVTIPTELKETLTRSGSGNSLPEEVKLYRFDFEKYGEQGFAISVGDERINTLLCYVEKGCIDDTLYNDAMAEYISNLKYAIYERLGHHVNRKPETKATIIQVAKGPLMEINWDQGWPYNYSCPYYGCTERNTNGRAWVGCAGVASAQVLAYLLPYDLKQQFPKLTEWRKIKEFYEYQTDIAEFGDYMKYIADQLGTKYGCGGSSSNMKATHNLLDRYYITHYWKSSNNLHPGRAVNSIHSYGKPVICRGQNKRKSGGHQWVIEGHRGWMYQGNPYEVVESKTQYWYCNWGWGGSGNGWYINYMYPKYSGDDSGNPMNGNFHYSNDFIYIGFPAWYD